MFLLYIGLCILKNNTSCIDSPLQQSEYFKKENRERKRENRKERQAIIHKTLVAQWPSGPVEIGRSGDCCGAVHQGGADNILELDRSCPPQELWIEPPPYPFHYPILKK